MQAEPLVPARKGASPLRQATLEALRSRLASESPRQVAAAFQLSAEALLRAASGCPIRIGTAAVIEAALARPADSGTVGHREK